MARVRYVGPEPVTVPELGRDVQLDEIVEVPDERYWGYACQTTNWEPIEEPPGFVEPGSETPPASEDQPQAEPADQPPAPKTPAKKTTAAKAPQKEG
ncbi:hypothetical protein ACFVGN_05580 [Streptomyces sp. NPDC057757]|uniref:hypothetical protein n=1 Tax=Streptomyces sp. NPDC057757 TaxID=3346241 RepID=UPI0036CB4644